MGVIVQKWNLVGFIAVALASVWMQGCASAPVTRFEPYGQDCSSFGANVDCVRVFYGTNRNVLLGDAAPPTANSEVTIQGAGSVDSGQLTLGRADIWLPILTERGGTRDRGDTPLARGRFPTDPDEQESKVFITRITAAGRERFVSDLQSAVDDDDDAVLLFVHGFNVDFDSALIRSAQLTVDLNLDSGFNPGAPVLFSWPSRGRMSLSDYRGDGQSAAEAQEQLKAFLDILTRDVRIRRINIIAHSMGNRVLTGALVSYAERYLAERPASSIEFRIILAAADVEEEVYRLAADNIARMRPNVTIYTSDDDWALKISQTINLRRRLGQTHGNRPFIREDPGYVTIDATPVATELFGVGHGYFSDNPFILSDIRCALADETVDVRALRAERFGQLPDGAQYYRTVPGVAADEACELRRETRPRRRGDPSIAPPPPPPVMPPPPPPPPPPPVSPENRVFTVYFDFDSANLTPVGQEIVDRAAEYAQWGQPVSIRVIGHTDTAGSAAYNIGLSNRMARTVADALVAKGVNAGLISIEGVGEMRPALPTPDGVQEPLNRRVEIQILFR